MLYKDRDWLYDKYWNEGKSINQIAKIIDRTYGCIIKWMVKLDVPRRSDSEAVKLSYTPELRKVRSNHSKNVIWNIPGHREKILPILKSNAIKHAGNTSIRMRGEGNPCWNGGKVVGKYSPLYNREFKDAILRRDGYKCMVCGDDYMMNIHHIDYDRSSLDPLDCIALCKACHNRTNFHRSYWHMKLMMLVRYGIERTPVL